MANDPTLSMEPQSPAAGDAVLFTASGEIPEGSAIVVSGPGDEEQRSPAFGVGAVPAGTGNTAQAVTISGGTSGNFTLTVTTPAGADIETDPIYYYSDSPLYRYPDSDDVVQALTDAIDDDAVGVTASHSGHVTTVVFGGSWSGQDIALAIDDSGIGGSPTSSVDEVDRVGGPYTFGPIQLDAGSYSADLVDDNDDSLLNDTVDFTIS